MVFIARPIDILTFSLLLTFVSLLLTFVESRRVPSTPPPVPIPRWVGIRPGVGTPTPVVCSVVTGGPPSPPVGLGLTATLATLHQLYRTSPAASHVLSPPVPGKLLIYIKSVLLPGCMRDWYWR